jgi:hypothetical protein
MKRRVWALLLLILINAYIFPLSIGSVVKIGGEDVISVPGGPAPIIDVTNPTIPSPQDPSKYEVPIPPTITPIDGGSPSSNSNASTASTNANGTAALKFNMISSVSGSSLSKNGIFFSEWRYLNDGDQEFNAKQSSSARNGTLSESKDISFYRDLLGDTSENARTSLLAFRDQIRFTGRSYEEKAQYLNKGDLVRNSFSSGDISKNSAYVGRFEDHKKYDYPSNESYFNQSTRFLLSTVNVGITRLDLRSANSSNSAGISEMFQGAIALNINFNSSLRYADKNKSSYLLPCCL